MLLQYSDGILNPHHDILPHQWVQCDPLARIFDTRCLCEWQTCTNVTQVAKFKSGRRPRAPPPYKQAVKCLVSSSQKLDKNDIWHNLIALFVLNLNALKQAEFSKVSIAACMTFPFRNWTCIHMIANSWSWPWQESLLIQFGSSRPGLQRYLRLPVWAIKRGIGFRVVQPICSRPGEKGCGEESWNRLPQMKSIIQPAQNTICP